MSKENETLRQLLTTADYDNGEQARKKVLDMPFEIHSFNKGPHVILSVYTVDNGTKLIVDIE